MIGNGCTSCAAPSRHRLQRTALPLALLAAFSAASPGMAASTPCILNELVAGPGHVCAIRGDSGLTCWGSNELGEASPPSGSFTSVAAGGNQSCAIRTNGQLVCWGNTGSQVPRKGVYKFVSAGDQSGCAISTDNDLTCWGNAGGGTAAVPPGKFTAVSVSAGGGGHVCAIREDSTIACWGEDGNDQASPPPGSGFFQVSSGYFHSCATGDDDVLCWGFDNVGQASPPAGPFEQVAAGHYHSCGVRIDGGVECWGTAPYGQASPPPGEFSRVATNDFFTCGLRTNGTAVCWGNNVGGSTQPPAQAPCAACGDGVQEGAEQCDDGNTEAADGCSATCQNECGDFAISGVEECDASAGSDSDCCTSVCRFAPLAAPCADDGDSFTADECSAEGECTHRDNSNDCDDEDFCTVQDHFVGIQCLGSARDCDDGNPCTDDSCSSQQGACLHIANSAPCSDGRFCTTNDSCFSGLCGGDPYDCDDGDQCTSDACVEVVDSCSSLSVASSCDDGLFCTVSDVCSGGSCTGIVRDCADQDAATTDSCNESSDECENGGPTIDCGDGATDEPEQCDDGDSTFQPGDYCSSDCTLTRCGVPTDDDATSPATKDALYTLRAAVGVAICDVRVCDVNGSGSITTGDALNVLRAAVGQPIKLDCTPSCPGELDYLLGSWHFEFETGEFEFDDYVTFDLVSTSECQVFGSDSFNPSIPVYGRSAAALDHDYAVLIPLALACRLYVFDRVESDSVVGYELSFWADPDAPNGCSSMPISGIENPASGFRVP
jgi:cysteine-rich repeat protein